MNKMSDIKFCFVILLKKTLQDILLGAQFDILFHRLSRFFFFFCLILVTVLPSRLSASNP